MMNTTKVMLSRLASIMFPVLMVGAVLLMLLTLFHSANIQAAPLDEMDPEIVTIGVTVDNVNIYDPTGGVGGSKTIFFNNTSPGIITLTVDSQSPDNPILASTVPTSTWQMTTTVPVTWTEVPGSVTYYYIWDQEAGTAIDDNTPGVITTTATAVTGENLPQADNNWFHLRTRDAAGNWAVDTAQIGPFQLDIEAPYDLTLNIPAMTTTIPFALSWGAEDVTSGIATYNITYQRNDHITWTNWLTEVTSTTAIFTGERGYTYTFQMEAIDQAQNSSTITETTQIKFYTLYLPVVVTPVPVPQVTWESRYQQGITTFTPQVTLTLGTVPSSTPTYMKIWEDTKPEPDWQGFQTKYPITLTSGNALKIINVRFKWSGNAESIVHQEPVYLLQNGDFHDSDTGWILDYDNGLPETVSNQRLFLGSSDYSCSNGVPIGFAQAKLTLTVPDGYQLQFEYTVHTQDKLGGPNNGLYDSFDVYVNTAEPPDILRTGNLTQPAGCANWYAISGIQTVAQYSGAITITFENWNRYDHWYNTYTELRRVWVVKR